MKLFMTAGELMDYPAGDNSGYESLKEDEYLFDAKLDESKYGPEIGTHGDVASYKEKTLHQSIKEKGVQTPVEISYSGDKELLTDGHHRVASAYDINPNMFVPVTYEDNPFVPSDIWREMSSRRNGRSS
jgi:hypothetical protein